MVLVIRPMVQTARDSALMDSCFSNLGSLGKAMELYLADNDEHYPRAEAWMEGVGTAIESSSKKPVEQVALKSYFRCPEIAREDQAAEFGYAFNDELSLRLARSIDKPSKTPLVFDSSDLAYNAHGSINLLPNPRRHMGNCVLWCDLSAKNIAARTAEDLR